MRRPFVRFIVNPKAGRYSKTSLMRYTAFLHKNGIDFDIFQTCKRGDGAVLASQAVEAGFVTHLIAAGGDGTLAEVAEPLVGRGVVLGILPFGTANVLARELAIPFSIKKNATLLVSAVLSGRKEKIYPVLFETETESGVVLQMFGAGFDAFIVKNTSPFLKSIAGRFAYLWTFIRAIFSYHPQDYDVMIDGVVYSSVQSLILSKGRYYAGSYKLLPSSYQMQTYARLLLFSALTKEKILRLSWALLRGNIAQCDGVTICLAKESVIIERGAVQPSSGLPLQSDGDKVGEGGVSLHLASEGLWVVTGPLNSRKL